MRRPAFAVAGAFAVAVSLPQSQGRAQEQKPAPVFRSNADLVTVPVFVKGSGGAVTGLQPADFVLTDNGVAQHVDSFSMEALPVDVTVLVETSHAIRDYAKSVNDQVRQIASRVHEGDRLEILGIDTYVNVLLPFGRPGREFDVNTFPRGGMTSVNDAIVAALLRQPDPDRQHLIIAITDTIDTMSTLDMAAVRAVARQSSATLVLSWVTMSQDEGEPIWMTTSERLDRHIRGPAQRTVPRRQQWTPHYHPPLRRNMSAFDVLREAADLTGGGLHTGGFIERNSAIVFNRIYSEFRRNYVLRYVPRGVARDGWHDVAVTVPRYPRLDIRARHGYFIEAGRPAPGATPAPFAPPPGSLQALRAHADSDDLSALRATVAAAEEAGTLTQLIADFRAAGNLWPARPRREFVAALAIADRAVRSLSEEIASAGIRLIERYPPLVRPPLGPDDFERLWLRAAALLKESAGRRRTAKPDEALLRDWSEEFDGLLFQLHQHQNSH